MYFPKQHYESIEPEKSGIKRFSASLFPQILHYDVTLPSMQCFDVILNDKGRNSVEQNAIVHDNSDRALLRHRAPLLQSTNVVNQ